MQCTTSDHAWVFNADLYDAAADEAELWEQLSLGLPLPLCTVSTAALITLASIALTLHSIVLCLALITLTRIAVRFRGTSSTRKAGLKSFSTLYCAPVLVMNVCAIIYNGIRLMALTRDISPSPTSTVPSQLALSFSPRGGATAGMNTLLFLVSLGFIAAVGFSVYNTVQVSVRTSTQQTHSLSTHSFSYAVHHFKGFCVGLVLCNSAIWSMLFMLPLAARSPSRHQAQLIIGALLIFLGNLPYWAFALSVSAATKQISESLRVAPSTVAVTGSIQSPTARTTDQPVAAGLNVAQVEQRRQIRHKFLVSSIVVRIMMVCHALINVTFLITVLAIATYRLIAYWMYYQQIYWALVCLVRLLAIKIPTPTAFG